MNAFRRLIHEAHRRSVWQVLGIYLVGAWIGYEIILNVMEGFGLPGWVAPFALVLFLIGLPVVVATAFVQEGGPERSDFARRGTSAAAARDYPDADARGTASPLHADPHDLVPGFETAADEITPAPLAAPVPPTPKRGPSRLTWPRAILAGMAAFLVLGASTAGYMGLRNAGIGPMGTLLGKGELTERDPIVLAQFTSAGGDTMLASALTEAFRVDFEQSPIVRLVGPGQVRDVLRRMQRTELEPLGPELALEIAEREGYKAVLTGEVNPAGAGYVLSARLIAVDGRVLASARETAADSTGVLGAIDNLSKALRERIGESLRTIRANAPLDQVTTPSIDALRAYTLSLHARSAGDQVRAIELLEQAIAADSGFAMAHRKLAAMLTSSVSPDFDRGIRAATRAYELRDRLTDKERHLAAAAYHAWVRGDADAAAREYRSVLDLDPDETTSLNNLSLILTERGDYEGAARLTARTVELGGSFLFYGNHADVLYLLGRVDEAFATLDRAAGLYPDNGSVPLMRAVYHAAEGRYATADSLLDEPAAMGRDPGMRGARLVLLSALDAVRGRAREALAHAADLERESTQLGAGEALRAALWTAGLRAALRADTAGAIRHIDGALARLPLADAPPLQRRYLELASAYARLGHAERAREVLREREQAIPAEQRGSQRDDELAVQALLAMADGDLERAEILLGEGEELTYCDACLLDRLAAAHADAGDTARAIALYERFLATRWMWRTIATDAEGLADALLRLAALHEATGEAEAAARDYARFIELWQDADPELQPRVSEARARLEAIVRRRG